MHFTRTIASVLHLRDPHDCKTLQTMEENSQTEEKPQPCKLQPEVKNSIRHVYETLEESNGVNGSGKVAKSKLQLLCATISRDTSMVYTAEDLSNYKEEEKSLTCHEFIQYLEEELLPKATEPIDHLKIQQLCWTIVHQKFSKQDGHLLTENEAFDQWLVFNILDLDEVSRVHKEELAVLLEKLSHAMGTSWDGKKLEEFCEEEDMSFWQYLDCLEKCYIAGADKNSYKEGLDEIKDYVLHEVIKQSYLIKKGHMVKSMKDRWFVLKPANLSYFTNRSCSDKKGEIIITQDTKVSSLPDSRKYRFNVVCGGTKTHYDLEARDQRTKQEWIMAIQKAIDTTDGPSVQKKERLQRRLERNERRLAKLEEERKKREQEELVRSQQQELELLRQKYSDAEAQAILEAQNLQEEKGRREELERLHQELQNLLLTEKEAREAEAKARALQEELLKDEKRRMEELEKLKAEKDQLLEEELKKRETLEEKQKLQDKMLEEERQRLDNLEKERQATETAMKEAQDKLAAAEEAARTASEEAKKKVREIKTCTGLAKPIGPHNPAFITHRGIGAFCEDDFEKIAKRHEKIPPKVLPKPKRAVKEEGENVDDEVDAETVDNEVILQDEKEGDIEPADKLSNNDDEQTSTGDQGETKTDGSPEGDQGASGEVVAASDSKSELPEAEESEGATKSETTISEVVETHEDPGTNLSEETSTPEDATETTKSETTKSEVEENFEDAGNDLSEKTTSPEDATEISEQSVNEDHKEQSLSAEEKQPENEDSNVESVANDNEKDLTENSLEPEETPTLCVCFVNGETGPIEVSPPDEITKDVSNESLVNNEEHAIPVEQQTKTETSVDTEASNSSVVTEES